MNDNKANQKFNLAMGDISSSIQECLDYVVTDGILNNASVRRLLDLKFPKNVMQKPNPLNLVFRDIAKLDMKNPIVDNLLKQFRSVKLKD